MTRAGGRRHALVGLAGLLALVSPSSADPPKPLVIVTQFFVQTDEQRTDSRLEMELPRRIHRRLEELGRVRVELASSAETDRLGPAVIRSLPPETYLVRGEVLQDPGQRLRLAIELKARSQDESWTPVRAWEIRRERLDLFPHDWAARVATRIHEETVKQPIPKRVFLSCFRTDDDFETTVREFRWKVPFGLFVALGRGGLGPTFVLQTYSRSEIRERCTGPPARGGSFTAEYDYVIGGAIEHGAAAGLVEVPVDVRSTIALAPQTMGDPVTGQQQLTPLVNSLADHIVKHWPTMSKP